MSVDGSSERAFDRIVEEIAAEKFAALKRIATTLETLIADLGRVASAAGDAQDGREREELRIAHEEIRRRALEWRWYLDVQREAMGLRPHRMVDEMFVVPGPLRPDQPRRVESS